VRTGAGVTTRTRYDAYGNLRDVYLPDGTHVAYVVDAQQRRTARLVNGVVTNRWLYQSQLAIAAEVDSAGTPIRTFTYGTHGNVPDLMTLANGRQYRLVTDHLGSVRLVIDVAADTVLQQLAYDAYGRVIVDTKPGFQPFGYAGGLYDPLTGLVRFGARDYDAEVGRWTAADPIGFGGGTPNVYEYVAGIPIILTDPSGRCIPWCVAGAVGGVIGAAQTYAATGSASQAGAGFVVGFISGALPGIGASRFLTSRLAQLLVSGFTAGAGGSLFAQWDAHCPIDWSVVLESAAVGAVSTVTGELAAGLAAARGPMYALENGFFVRYHESVTAIGASVFGWALEQGRAFVGSRFRGN